MQHTPRGRLNCLVWLGAPWMTPPKMEPISLLAGTLNKDISKITFGGIPDGGGIALSRAGPGKWVTVNSDGFLPSQAGNLLEI